MKKNPCYQCEERQLGCHSNCPKYIEWSNKNKQINYAIRKSKYSEINEYKSETSKHKRER